MELINLDLNQKTLETQNDIIDQQKDFLKNMNKLIGELHLCFNSMRINGDRLEAKIVTFKRIEDKLDIVMKQTVKIEKV